MKKLKLVLILMVILSMGLIGCSKQTSTTIESGSEISDDGINIVFDDFEFSKLILPRGTSSAYKSWGTFYPHYQAENGKVYYHISMDLTNNNKQNISADKLIQAELVYDNEYTYTPEYILLDSADKLDFHEIDTPIAPLETRGVRVLFYIPEEIKSSDKSVEVKLKIDGKNYLYKAR